ncbi:unnamed protein product [Aphanomyces euteiches]
MALSRAGGLAALQFGDSSGRCSITAQQHLTCESLARQIKSAAACIGEHPNKYSTHSLRSGGAPALFRGGASDLSIQLFGRCKSDAYKLYICTPASTPVNRCYGGSHGVHTILHRGTATPHPWLAGQ